MNDLVVRLLYALIIFCSSLAFFWVCYHAQVYLVDAIGLAPYGNMAFFIHLPFKILGPGIAVMGLLLAGKMVLDKQW